MIQTDPTIRHVFVSLNGHGWKEFYIAVIFNGVRCTFTIQHLVQAVGTPKEACCDKFEVSSRAHTQKTQGQKIVFIELHSKAMVNRKPSSAYR